MNVWQVVGWVVVLAVFLVAMAATLSALEQKKPVDPVTARDVWVFLAFFSIVVAGAYAAGGGFN